MDAAVRLLAYRSRTEAEIRRRLSNRYSDKAIDTVVQKLLKQNLLDDVKFAAEWRDSRIKHKPRSKNMIRQELYRLGVSDTNSTDALTDVDDQEMAYQAGQRLADRLVSRNTTKEDFKRKLTGHLQRRGFNYQVISTTMKRLQEDFSLSEGDTGYN
ncbi:MAG: regulatory protein RecX [Chloroflexota bacterium]|nr:regulatory protein RecX [Chloroflexota bacterium]